MTSLGVVRRRSFALVWIGGLVSLTGDWMLLAALPLHAYAVTGSTLATGLMLAARVAPRLLLSSVAGVFVDRWDRRRTLIGANLALALGLLPLLLVRSADWLWLVYVVALAQACMAQLVAPAEGALLPRLVGDDDLLAANSLNALNNNLARLIGPPLGGLVVAMTGLSGVALFDAASFLVAAAMFALVRVPVTSRDTARTPRPPRPGAGEAEPAGVVRAAEQPGGASNPWAAVAREWLAGLRLIRRNRTLSVLLAFMAITSVGEGIMGTLAVPFVVDVLGSDEIGFGWLLSAQAIGGLIGSLLLAQHARRFEPARLLGLGAIALGLCDLVTFNYSVFIPGLAPALVMMALAGGPSAAMGVGYPTLVQRSTADAYRGRVLGTNGAVAATATLVGLLIGGVLGERLGIVNVLNVQGVVYCLAGVMVLAVLRSARLPLTPRPPLPAPCSWRE